MTQHMFPIGVSDFAKLIRYQDPAGEHYLFIDKTLMIKEFIYAGDEIALITRPRRFGKTLSLSMMQHFFAKEVEGIPTKGLFEGLAISKHPEVMALQGQFPVIFLTLKEVRGKNFEEAYARLKGMIATLFDQHQYLLASDKMEEHNKEMFRKILWEKATQAHYESSLRFLSHMLFQHTGKKVMLLLDEYDTPLHDAHVHGYYEEMRSLIATLFNKAFKGNDYLHKGLITGILKIVKSSLFSELNNVEVYSCFSSPLYADAFGFTPAETDDFLDRAGLPQKAHELKEMYNGYQIEEYILYNPFSIVSFTKNASIYQKKGAPMEKALVPYWVNSGSTDIIKDLIAHNTQELAQDLDKLLHRATIAIRINPDIILGKSLKSDRTSFWSLMLLAGYMRIEKTAMGNFGEEVYTLSFVNEEVRESMRKIVVNAVTNGRKDHYYNSMDALIRGDVSAFQTFLEDYLQCVPSFLDKGGKHYEQFYHGLVLGMSACLSRSHIVTSNRISGGGIYDICIEPKDQSQYGIILELKVSAKTERLQEVAETALTQIKTLGYKRDLTQRGIKKFILMGVSFNKSEMEIRYEIVG